MKQLFLYLWFICMSTLTYAQQVTLSGKVEDAYTGNGLQGVMVTIRPAAGNRILKFTKTQADGVSCCRSMLFRTVVTCCISR